jgi:hypothetical protein
MSPETKIVIKMPAEAAEKLLCWYQNDRKDFQDCFDEFEFKSLKLRLTTPANPIDSIQDV